MSLLPVSLFAQSDYLDSLTNKLETSRSNNIEYSQLLLEISLEYSESNPDTALVLAERVVSLCHQFQFDSMLAQAYLHVAIAHSTKSQYNSSTLYCYKALRLAEDFQDVFTQADVYNNLGIDLMYQGEYRKALECFNKTKNLSESIEDDRLLGNAFNNLGIIYGYLEDYENELYYYKRAAEFFKRKNRKEGYANALLNTGSTCTAMGQYQKAQTYYDSALVIYLDIDYPLAQCQTYQDICINYIKSGNIHEAINAADLAMKVAQNMDSDLDRSVIFDLYRQIYEYQGDMTKAYLYQQRHYTLKEEIFNSEKAKQIGEIRTRFETEAKQGEIEKLTLENQLKTESLSIAKLQIALMALVICLVAFGFWYWIKKHRSEKIEQDLRFEALQKRYIELLNGPAQIDLEIDLISFNKKLVNPLTEREYETLKLSMSGKTKQEIAEALFVSINTVKYHVRNIYSKLGVSNKKEVLEYVTRAS